MYNNDFRRRDTVLKFSTERKIHLNISMPLKCFMTYRMVSYGTKSNHGLMVLWTISDAKAAKRCGV